MCVYGYGTCDTPWHIYVISRLAGGPRAIIMLFATRGRILIWRVRVCGASVLFCVFFGWAHALRTYSLFMALGRVLVMAAGKGLHGAIPKTNKSEQ